MHTFGSSGIRTVRVRGTRYSFVYELRRIRVGFCRWGSARDRANLCTLVLVVGLFGMFLVHGAESLGGRRPNA